jgi:hypothetical protein
MFGVRVDPRIELALAAGALLVLVLGSAAPTQHGRCPYLEQAQPTEADDHTVLGDEDVIAARLRYADGLYREPAEPSDECQCLELQYLSFEEAANVVASVAGHDVDLQNLAAQYRQLAHAWRVGMTRDVPAAERFHALRRAWKLDTVLGGVHREVIQQAVGDIALIAAPELARAGDQDAADLAIHTAEVLGR